MASFRSRWLLSSIRAILFMACLTFVIHRALQSFSKYLEKPQNTNHSYMRQSRLPFPLLTFCMKSENEWDFIHRKEEILKRCHLENYDYFLKGEFVGKDHENCTDARILRKMLSTKPEEMKFSTDDWYISSNIFLRGFTKTYTDLMIPVEDWQPIPTFGTDECFTFDLSRYFKEDLEEIEFRSDINLTLTLHSFGLFGSKFGTSKLPLFVGEGMNIPIEYEVVNLLDHDGDNCIKDQSYSWFDCIHDYIYDTSLEKFNCTSPFGLKYDKICTDKKSGKIGT